MVNFVLACLVNNFCRLGKEFLISDAGNANVLHTNASSGIKIFERSLQGALDQVEIWWQRVFDEDFSCRPAETTGVSGVRPGRGSSPDEDTIPRSDIEERNSHRDIAPLYYFRCLDSFVGDKKGRLGNLGIKILVFFVYYRSCVISPSPWQNAG